MSRKLAELVNENNADYAVKDVVNVIPFRAGAERIGNSALRVYLREQNKVTVLTMSELLFEKLTREMAAAVGLEVA